MEMPKLGSQTKNQIRRQRRDGRCFLWQDYGTEDSTVHLTVDRYISVPVDTLCGSHHSISLAGDGFGWRVAVRMPAPNAYLCIDCRRRSGDVTN